MDNRREIRKAQALIQKCLDERWYPIQKGITTIGNSDCALCAAYCCYECPIGLDTGEDSCGGTPYDAAAMELRMREHTPNYNSGATDDMVEYLEDLIFKVEDLYNGA